MNEEILIAQFKAGDLKAANALVSLNEGLVKTIFLRHYNSNVGAEDDFLQEGRLGVLEACRRYDPTKAKQFGFYKSLWIRKKMGKLNKKELSFTNKRNAFALSYNNVCPATQGAAHDIKFILDYANVSDILPKKDHDKLVHAALQYKVTKDNGIYRQLKNCC